MVFSYLKSKEFDFIFSVFVSMFKQLSVFSSFNENNFISFKKYVNVKFFKFIIKMFFWFELYSFVIISHSIFSSDIFIVLNAFSFNELLGISVFGL